MISYQQVFQEIERQLQQAQKTNDVSVMREALSAIRSLSEVALSKNGESPESAKKVENPQVVLQPQVQSLNSMDAKPLNEEDGSNGDSIFDF